MKTMARLALATCAVGLLSLQAIPAHAGVIIYGTRVIFPAEQQEVVVRLENKGDRPALVQTWLDTGDLRSTPATAQTPFTLSPPIFRIEPHQQQALRLRYSGETPPTDRESLYWLNVLEVPPVATGAEQNNQIELAFRTRLRVFLRPQSLPYPVGSAPAKLQWKLVPRDQGYALQATNPTPYHISLTTVDLLSEGKRFSKAPNQEANDGLLMPAGDVKLFALPELRDPPRGASKVEFTTVSDFGARVRHSANLASSTTR
ncbi:molecular chaperone [Pseudomonas sp. BCA14]|uniref:fimbrial biogenesis chaperone n=1 Tax=unclassified Pseudomonas TaxID=196821 RepID=UPI00106E1518|nr:MULTISPECIES: fimbria/pilus periplasmic chaperone [unclassified Pseudomonas]TFF04955.1 molecular chaperone [Pseudomonas sp. JMN1]TFF06433.1 molecular chaperone [Pseudomonas sp. BCA17]TFF22422.1 molecular chaperone [Pseudomonas sp. BCA14]TFF26819.1 molecular chaperone [Pseudomonas sp. BCA13]